MNARPLVVVGDALLDVDVHGTVERLCPDAPVPVLDVRDETARPGGAALAAVLAPPPVVLVTGVSDDRSGDRLRGLVTGAVTLVAGPVEGGTCVKCRWHSADGPLLRTDSGSGHPAAGFGEAVRPELPDVLRDAAAVLVSDYGRGVAGEPQVRSALAGAVRSGTTVVWDPHPRGPAPIRGVVATPNAAEAAAALGLEGEEPDPAWCGARLLERWGCTAVVVTAGARGAVVVTTGGSARVPAPLVDAGDPCGAGDAFAGALAAALGSGRTLDRAVEEAVETAAAFVARGGATTVRRAGAQWTQQPREPLRAAR